MVPTLSTLLSGRAEEVRECLQPAALPALARSVTRRLLSNVTVRPGGPRGSLQWLVTLCHTGGDTLQYLVTLFYNGGDTLQYLVTLFYNGGDTLQYLVTLFYNGGDTLQYLVTLCYNGGDTLQYVVTLCYNSGDTLQYLVTLTLVVVTHCYMKSQCDTQVGGGDTLQYPKNFNVQLAE